MKHNKIFQGKFKKNETAIWNFDCCRKEGLCFLIIEMFIYFLNHLLQYKFHLLSLFKKLLITWIQQILNEEFGEWTRYNVVKANACFWRGFQIKLLGIFFFYRRWHLCNWKHTETRHKIRIMSNILRKYCIMLRINIKTYNIGFLIIFLLYLDKYCIESQIKRFKLELMHFFILSLKN